jgi:hypothetical protein
MHARLDHHELIAERLRRLPAVELDPSEGWSDLQRRIARAESATRARRQIAALATAASVGVLALLVGLRLQTDGAGARPVATERANARLAVDELVELQDQSQMLEQVLAGLPERPAVARAGTALPIDELQAHVQWLDHQLTVATATERNPAASEELWRERVATMSSLVQLRYLEAQGTTL